MAYLEGVYWDLDGTIANTELEAHLPAFNSAFSEFGLNWFWNKSTYIDLLKVNGGKNRILYYSKLINSYLEDDLIIKIHKKKQLFYLENIEKNSVQLKTGVYRLTKELYDKNVRQFIVTSSSRKQVDYLVKNLFSNFNPFEFIISSDDVKLQKPNPFPYQEAMRQSGISNINSIVFEDSNSGIKSSLAANLPTIHVPSNIPTFLEKDIELDCVFDTLGDTDKVANVIKGPKLVNDYIDYSFLDNYLMSCIYAKN